MDLETMIFRFQTKMYKINQLAANKDWAARWTMLDRPIREMIIEAYNTGRTDEAAGVPAVRDDPDEATDWPAFARDMISGDPERVARHLPRHLHQSRHHNP